MKHISASALQQKLREKEHLQLIDVREPKEHAQFNIGGELLPLSELLLQADKISTTLPVVLYCQKGIRSQLAIQRLQAKYGFTNLVNLEGGMDAWIKTLPGTL